MPDFDGVVKNTLSCYVKLHATVILSMHFVAFEPLSGYFLSGLHSHVSGRQQHYIQIVPTKRLFPNFTPIVFFIPSSDSIVIEYVLPSGESISNLKSPK